MSNSEPTIIANGCSDEQIVQWMRKKLAAIDQLSELHGYRQESQSLIAEYDGMISCLSLDATLNIERQVQDPIPHQ